MSDLINNCFNKIKKLFAEDDTASQNSRIESASITSNRLKALQRMRMNSPTTPDYKLEGDGTAETPTTQKLATSSNIDNVDLDFGMKIGNT
jgi:hypothetical protein